MQLHKQVLFQGQQCLGGWMAAGL